MEGLENELWRRWSDGKLGEWAELTYVTAHSPTFPSLHLRHYSFSNTSVASPKSQLVLQPFFLFSYVTGSSPGEPSMLNSEMDSSFQAGKSQKGLTPTYEGFDFHSEKGEKNYT